MSQRPPAACPCCGYLTGCTTCPICFWTDDRGRDGVYVSESVVMPNGSNGDLSLAAARLNFAIYGASHPRYQDFVRPPREEELPR